MSNYQPDISDIVLSGKEVKILRSFADKKSKPNNEMYLPLLDLGLLEYRNPNSPKSPKNVAISIKGQQYLKTSSRNLRNDILLIGTFIAAVLSVIIPLIRH